MTPRREDPLPAAVKDFCHWVAGLEPKYLLDKKDLIEALKVYGLWSK